MKVSPRVLSGRQRIGLFGTVIAVVLGFAGPASTATTGTPLRTLAANHGIYFGDAASGRELSDSAYSSIIGTQFGALTPVSEMKWAATEPKKDQYNWAPGDAIVSFAKAHNQIVRGHNLVWHKSLPSWLTSGGYSASQVTTILHNHISAEVGHFRSQVYAWDVVNEPFNDDGSYRTDLWYKAMGANYIADALTWAHAADPNAKLYLNDYNIEGVNSKSNAMYNLVKSLKAKGVPIGGVGFETHRVLGHVPSDLRANLARFAALGVNVAITELDIRMALPATSAKLAQQAGDYTTVVKDCLAVSGCAGVSVWGFTDADSWIPGSFPGYGEACLYNAGFNPKPAYYAVQTALG